MKAWSPRPKRSLFWLGAACSFALVSTLAVLTLTTCVERREFDEAMAEHDRTRVKIETLQQLVPQPEVMTATWYGAAYHGRRTASGERFDRFGMTAAHRTLPFGTRVRVRHEGWEAIVRITDRGPLEWTGSDLDVSERAAELLRMKRLGRVTVVAEVLP